MPLDDRVGARGIHQVDIPQPVGWIGEDHDVPFPSLVRLISVAQHLNLSGRGGDTFGQHPLAQQGVDEGGLAGVEFSNHHQQEELLKLTQGLLQQRHIRGRGIQPHQREPQPFQLQSLFFENRILFLAQQFAQQQIPPSCNQVQRTSVVKCVAPSS